MTNSKFAENRTIIKIAGFSLLAVGTLTTLANCITIVPGGSVAVLRRLGAIQEAPLTEGIHFKLPFADSVDLIDTRTEAYEISISAASRDLQEVKTTITITYNLSGGKAPQALRLIGDRAAVRAAVLTNGVPQSTKSVISVFTVDELVTKRELVRQKVEDQVRVFVSDSLDKRNLADYVQVTSVAITDFSFSPQFAAAIEAKSKADQERQQALIEKQKLLTQAEAEGNKLKTLADAKAYQLKVESTAEADAVLRVITVLSSNTNYADYLRAKAMQDRWDGKLPTVTGGSSLGVYDPLGGAAAADAKKKTQ